MTFQLNQGVAETNPLPVAEKGSDKLASGCVTASSQVILIVPARAGRRSVLLSRDDNVMVLIGNETLTVENGYRAFEPGMTTARIETSAAIYGLIPSAVSTITVNVSYLELF